MAKNKVCLKKLKCQENKVGILHFLGRGKFTPDHPVKTVKGKTINMLVSLYLQSLPHTHTGKYFKQIILCRIMNDEVAVFMLTAQNG